MPLITTRISFCLLLAGVPAGALAAPQPMACSPESGLANINELKSKGGGSGNLEFAEFKVLQDSVDITGWQICGSFGGNKNPCMDVGAGDGTWHTIEQPGGQPDDTKAVYDANTWITYELPNLKAEEGEVILLDENGDVIDYIRWSSQAGICTSNDFSWDVPESCGTCFDQRDPDQKDFARGPDGTGDWGNNGDEPSEGSTNDPEPPAADHFAIIHDGIGINCQPEPVTIEAHDAVHGIIAGYATQIALGTSTAHGDWTGIAAGTGTLINNGNGNATYQFLATDNGQATLLLHDTFVETVNIDVSDGTAVEAFAEDPGLSFARSGFAFRVNGAPGVLPQQISGKPSDTGHNATSLELEAINTNDDTGACEAMLVGNVDVDFALECNDPASCAANAMTVNGLVVPSNPEGAVTSRAPVTLDFGDATDTSAPLIISHADAGQVTLHAHYDPGFISTEVMRGSTSFSVRPFGLQLSASGGTATAANPAATTAGGPVFTAAGDGFNVDVRAVAWQAVDDVDNDGVPDGHADNDATTLADLSDNATVPSFGGEAIPASIALSGYLVAPAGGNNAPLAGSTGVTGFSAGTATSNPVWFNEVGIFEIEGSLSSGSYLGGEDVIGASGHVGRFVPGFFEVTVPADACSDDGGFTYSGQDIGEVVVTAYSNSGTGVVTSNYDGGLGFSKTVNLTEASGVAGTVTGSPVDPLLFNSGIVSLSTVGFLFTDPETAYTDIGLRATDSDGVTSTGAVEEGTEIRSGRLQMNDGNAPTISDGQVALVLQTWQQIAAGVFDWAPHSADVSCTSPVVGDFSLSGYTDNLQAGETTITGLTWNSGQGAVTLGAPGAGNNGAVEVTGNIDAWLRIDTGSGLANPVGTMRFFDVFRPEEGFIDRHEVIGN